MKNFIHMGMGMGTLGVILDSGGGGPARRRASRPVSRAVTNTDIGKALRRDTLELPPAKAGFTPDPAFPEVYGVLKDWNLGDQVATIVALRDGSASLYTTDTFGIIGGQGHAHVREAAARAVQEAGRLLDRSEALTGPDFPYPPFGTVYYYLLTYQGVRRLTGYEAAIDAGTDVTRPLFAAAQDVLSGLRTASGL